MKNKKLTSVTLTIVIIAILLLSGPVSAITVSVDTNKSTYYKADDSTITITGTIDLENTEILNITEYVVQIKNSTSNLIKNCSISSGGTVSNCNNITATVTYNGDYMNGTRYGYGYGYSSLSGTYTTANQTFGYGYGYGYSAGASNEIVITISWDINSDTADNPDDYTANIFTKAQGNGNTRYYADSTAASFTIKSGSAPSSDADTGSKAGGICSPTWECTDWSKCSNGKQTRTCEDKWSCGDEEDKPKEIRSCKMPSKPKKKTAKPVEQKKPAPEPTPEEPEPMIPLGAGIVISIIGLIIAVIIAVKIKMK